MKQLVRLIAIVAIASAASCSHLTAIPNGTPLAIARPGIPPPTVHVIPFYDYSKSGYGVPGGTSYGNLIGSAKALYGATMLGGSTTCSTPFGSGSQSGCGIVYRLVQQPGKRKYKLDVLHTFEGSPNDGAASLATLLADKSGDFFGTTFYGGQYDRGTVFELQPKSSGYTETILHSFGHGKDGAYPISGVIEVNGILYGTTVGGGKYTDYKLCGHYGGAPDGTCGTVYSLNPATGEEHVVHSFGKALDGASPQAALLDVAGTLYGTTDLGGTSPQCGTVFSVRPNGHERVVHSFRNVPDACNPFASLISVHDTLYGTTCCGGRNFCSNSCTGTLFSVDIASGDEQVLHDFGKGTDGSQPHAAVVYVGGVLYGTTDIGGGTSCVGGAGCGTIFSYAPSASNPAYSVVYAFKGKADGAGPASALLYSHGAFYGVTMSGGKKGLGTGIKLHR